MDEIVPSLFNVKFMQFCADSDQQGSGGHVHQSTIRSEKLIDSVM